MSTTEVERDGGVLIVTLNDPGTMNALSDDMIAEIIAALDHADQDDSIRSVVVAGRGRAFCSGADLRGGADALDRRRDGETHPRDRIGRLALRIYGTTKPVLGAITGHAVGAGLTMTLAMDIRVVADDAKLGFVFTRRGITPEGCSTWFLPRLVGMARAVDWMCSGRMITPAEALSAGLVSAAVPAPDVLATTLWMAHRIAADTAPVAVGATLALLRHMALATSPLEAHVAESVMLAELFGSPDAGEGVQAFREKRDPRFLGRPSLDAPSAIGAVIPPWAAGLDQ